MSDLKTVNRVEDMQLKGGNKMGEGDSTNQRGSVQGGQRLGLSRRRDPASDNCYVKALKRIVYLSLVIWSAGFRKLVETVTGIKLPRIHIDHRMVEGHRTNPEWVSFYSYSAKQVSEEWGTFFHDYQGRIDFNTVNIIIHLQG